MMNHTLSFPIICIPHTNVEEKKNQKQKRTFLTPYVMLQVSGLAIPLYIDSNSEERNGQDASEFSYSNDNIQITTYFPAPQFSQLEQIFFGEVSLVAGEDLWFLYD